MNMPIPANEPLIRSVVISSGTVQVKSLNAMTLDVNDYAWAPTHKRVVQIKAIHRLRLSDPFPDVPSGQYLVNIMPSVWAQVEYNDRCREIESVVNKIDDLKESAVTQ
jgi:hypothetical protein